MQRRVDRVTVASMRFSAVLALWLYTTGLAHEDEFPGFLIISAPRLGKISWSKLPRGDKYDGMETHTLISGLKHPQGVAVDQKRQRLYVADPDLRKVVSYQLDAKKDKISTDGRQTVLAENLEARWVAVDGVGNVFFSDEPNNNILKLRADRVLGGNHTPEVVYDGSALMQVNEPGGVAVDNFHVFWTNKHFGTEVGSLLKGSEAPSSADNPDNIQVLASNAIKSYGVCLALGNVFYTGSEQFLYGVPKDGGPVVEVSSSLHSPRGCIWDRDGTVYVADRGANAIYAFAGNMPTITRVQLKRVVTAEDAFGLTIALPPSAAQRLYSSLLGVLLTVLVATRLV